MLKTLKEAFNKTFKDPEFPMYFTKLTNEHVEPITGDDIEEILQKLPSDPNVMKVYRQIIGGGPLPPTR